MAEVKEEMNKKVWHKIFKDYIDSYYSVHKLAKKGIVDEEDKHKLLER